MPLRPVTADPMFKRRPCGTDTKAIDHMKNSLSVASKSARLAAAAVMVTAGLGLAGMGAALPRAQAAPVPDYPCAFWNPQCFGPGHGGHNGYGGGHGGRGGGHGGGYGGHGGGHGGRGGGH